MKSLFGVLVASFALALTPASAFAVDRLVEQAPTGVDAGDCSVSPCASITYATGQAVSGDRVLIGNGTFVQTDAIRPVDKSVEYIGNGPANTIVTANGANNFLQAGVFRFQWNNRDYAVKNMTIQGLPSTDAGGGLRYAVYAQPTHPTPAPTPSTYGLDLSVDNVQVIGNTGSPAKTEIAVYTAVSTGTASVTNSTITNVMGNSLLFEQHQGALTVSGNTISKPLSSSGAVVAVMAHADASNANPYNITGAQTITNNTITAGSAVMVLAGWPYTSGFGPSAFLGGVTISGNTIDTTTGASVAISLINATNANDGTPGRIVSPVLSGNSLTGAGTSGINLQGYIPDASVTSNDIRGRLNGILLNRHTRTAAPNPGTFSHVPTGTIVSGNQIVNNTFGVTTDPGASIGATLNGNWWGCNEGPAIAAGPAAGDCDTVSTGDSGPITLANWIVLRISASPASALSSTGLAAVTAGFDQLNTGGAAPSAFKNGTVLPMSANAGTLSNTNPTLTSLLATTTFTAAGSVGRTASAQYDHETVTHSWANDTTPPVVTVTNPAGTLYTNNPNATINYTVSDSGGGVTCNIADGSSIPLTVGPNMIVVFCTDAAGNGGYDSVLIVFNGTPPTVTINSPTAGAVINASSTTLTYTATSAQGTVSCTPASGASVPLAIGSNTLSVTCTDNFGNTASASVTVSRPDALPQCARNLMITDVTRVGSRTRIRGIARTQFAGQNISFEYQPTGTKVIGKAKVSSTGAFQIVVKRPSKPVWTSNSARYRAVLGSTKTSWVKLSRRMGATAVTYDGNGGLKVTGSASLPIAKGQPVRVMRSDACGAWRQIGTLRMNSDGTFSGTVPTGGGSEAAVNIRIQARVAKASNPRYSFNTYSIVQPVIVER